MAVPSAPPRTKKILSPLEIARIAYDAGFGRLEGCPAPHLVAIVAKVLAESSGRVGAIGGPNPNGTFDYGLAQINEEHVTTGPWYFDRHLLLTDAQYNLNAAYAIHREAEARGSSIADIWHAVQTPEEEKQAAQAADVVYGGTGKSEGAGLEEQQGGIGGNLATDIDDWFKSRGGFLTVLAQVGMAVAGGVLIVLAIMFIAKQWALPAVKNVIA